MSGKKKTNAGKNLPKSKKISGNGPFEHQNKKTHSSGIQVSPEKSTTVPQENGDQSVENLSGREKDEVAKMMSNNSAIHESMEREVRPLLDIVDRLRHLGIERDLPIPQIAVFGDQSSGKSSGSSGLQPSSRDWPSYSTVSY